MQAVEHFLRSSAEPSVAAGGGATALHAAATAGHLAIVEALIAANADVDIQVHISLTLILVCSFSLETLSVRDRD